MMMDSRNNRAASLTKILLAAAVLLGALTFLKIGSFVNASQAMILPAQMDADRADASEVKKALAQTKARAEEIKKKNLFVPASARQHPVSAVTGILGQEALIGDKWYKVGEAVGEARIVAIEPTKVRIAWDGQEKEFAPIGVVSSAGGPGSQPGPPSLKPGPGAPARAVITGSRPEPNRSYGGLSAQEKEKKKQQQQWMNANEAEKQRFRDQMGQRSRGKNR